MAENKQEGTTNVHAEANAELQKQIRDLQDKLATAERQKGNAELSLKNLENIRKDLDKALAAEKELRQQWYHDAQQQAARAAECSRKVTELMDETCSLRTQLAREKKYNDEEKSDIAIAAGALGLMVGIGLTCIVAACCSD